MLLYFGCRVRNLIDLWQQSLFLCTNNITFKGKIILKFFLQLAICPYKRAMVSVNF